MPVAVITGAARGIGRQIAEALAAQGYSLALNDLRAPDDTLTALGPHRADAAPFVGDVSDEAFVAKFADAVVSRFGRVDVLVNNAGISCISRAEETTAAELRRVLEVNLIAPFLLCRAFGAHMLAACAGSIVNIASIAGLAGISERAAYNASKHGLIGLTRTLAAEWGGAASGPTPSVRAGSRPRWMTSIRRAGTTPTSTSRAGSLWDASRRRRMSPARWRFSQIHGRAASSTASRCRWTEGGRPTQAGSTCATVSDDTTEGIRRLHRFTPISHRANSSAHLIRARRTRQGVSVRPPEESVKSA
jgi:NAD(P)-dependent dehydrogenase (short-subunit alcohol dehydrogenase family)